MNQIAVGNQEVTLKQVRSGPVPLEWVTFIYWASLNTNEISQILSEEGKNLAEKIWKHLFLGGSVNTWNVIDTMVLFMCLTAGKA